MKIFGQGICVKIGEKNQEIREIPRTFQGLHVFFDRISCIWGFYEMPIFQGLREIPGYTYSL